MVSFKRRGYLWVFFSGVCLFALAGCASSSSQAKSASTAKPMSATVFVASVAPVACVGTYSDAANVYRIACPTGWRVTSSVVVPNGIALVAPNNLAGLLISTTPGEMTASQHTTFLQNYLDKIGATNMNVTQPEQQVTAGANTWTQKKATFSRNGIDYTVAQYATVHNGKTIFVEAVAPTTNFNAAETTFQAELASLKFT